jgi:hypothetical protein
MDVTVLYDVLAETLKENRLDNFCLQHADEVNSLLDHAKIDYLDVTSVCADHSLAKMKLFLTPTERVRFSVLFRRKSLPVSNLNSFLSSLLTMKKTEENIILEVILRHFLNQNFKSFDVNKKSKSLWNKEISNITSVMDSLMEKGYIMYAKDVPQNKHKTYSVNFSKFSHS